MSKSRTVGVIYCCLGKLNRGENQKREVRRKKVTGLQNGLCVVIGKEGEKEKYKRFGEEWLIMDNMEMLMEMGL